MGVLGIQEVGGLVIIDALLDVVFGVATWLVSQFPDNELELSIGDGAGYLAWVGHVVNLTALSAALGVIVAGETAMGAVRGGLFVWRLVK